MSQPIVIGHHLIWTAYGCWLPNDPRGSGSKTVVNDWIADLGDLHQGRRKVQPARAVVTEFHEAAEIALKHPLLRFAPDQFSVVADAFANVVTQQRYTCYACAIMPDHAHLLIRKHRDTAEQMIECFQQSSRDLLIEAGLREVGNPVWTNGGWKVFIDHPDAMRRTIGYIDANLRKEGLPDQCWPFVAIYDGWPLHPGHNPRSPFALRLRGEERRR